MIRSDGGIDRMRAILNGVATGLSASSAAPAVDEFMRGQMSLGQTPEGEAWKPTQDGRVPLRGAAKAYEQRLSGNAIIMSITGRHAFHHFGAGGKPVRRQLPAGAMPEKLGQAIRQGLVKLFRTRARSR